jgi:hypothetical protein
MQISPPETKVSNDVLAGLPRIVIRRGEVPSSVLRERVDEDNPSTFGDLYTWLRQLLKHNLYDTPALERRPDDTTM